MTSVQDSAGSTAQTVRFGGNDKKERPLGRSIQRGLLCTCPNCGKGKLFKSFLKPVDACSVCGEDLHHQRADDLPPYIIIFITGHVALGGFMMTDMVWPVSAWVHLAIWAPMTVLVAFLMIQPVKGGVIGLQWALRMHGFGQEDDSADPGRGGPVE